MKATTCSKPKRGRQRKEHRPFPDDYLLDSSRVGRWPEFQLAKNVMNRKTRKWWISPENEVIPLTTLHYEYFRNPIVSEKYGVPCRDEVNTRLDALRVGFLRINYELNGGHLTLETMRWDRNLRKVVDKFILDNAESIDVAHLHLLNRDGQLLQLGCAPLLQMRLYETPINRLTLGSWNNLRVTKL